MEDPALEPSHLKGISHLSRFCAQKSKCPRRFCEIGLAILHTCCTCPFRGLTSGGGVILLVFLAETFWYKVVHIFQKNLKWRKIRPKSKKRKWQVRCSQGHIDDVCEISRSESEKRRWHSPGNTFRAFNLYQPVGIQKKRIDKTRKRIHRKKNVFWKNENYSYNKTLSIKKERYSGEFVFVCLFDARPIYLLRSLFFSFLPLPRLNSDLRSLSRLCSPLPTTARAFIFIARRVQSFFPSSTRIESRLPALRVALSSAVAFCIFFLSSEDKTKKSYTGTPLRLSEDSILPKSATSIVSRVPARKSQTPSFLHFHSCVFFFLCVSRARAQRCAEWWSASARASTA